MRAGLFARQPFLDSMRKDVLESLIFYRTRIACAVGRKWRENSAAGDSDGPPTKKGERGVIRVPLVFLVGMRGFEPPASASRTRRSTRLSHIPIAEAP